MASTLRPGDRVRHRRVADYVPPGTVISVDVGRGPTQNDRVRVEWDQSEETRKYFGPCTRRHPETELVKI